MIDMDKRLKHKAFVTIVYQLLCPDPDYEKYKPGDIVFKHCPSIPCGKDWDDSTIIQRLEETYLVFSGCPDYLSVRATEIKIKKVR